MTENITPVRMAIVWKFAALAPDGTVAVHGPEMLIRVLEPGETVPTVLVPMTEGQQAVILEALERMKATAADPAERTLRALEALAAKPAPPITINLPAQVAPVVNVALPERPPMRKLIERDGDGRIAALVDEPTGGRA